MSKRFKKISKIHEIKLDIPIKFNYNIIVTYIAAMAQLVERVLGKDEVGGSNPPSSSIKERPSGVLFRFADLLRNYMGRGRGDASRGSLFRRDAPYKSV